MTEMGAPADMVDTMSSAAQDGFDSAIGSGMSPMEAFDAAVKVLMQLLVMDHHQGMEGDMPPPGMEGDMPPGYGWRHDPPGQWPAWAMGLLMDPQMGPPNG